MKRLYFIRHGETAWNKENRVQGYIDTDLNETGIDQARKIAYRLKDERIDIIFSSTLKRAYLTAEEIKKYHTDVELIKKEELIEIGFGEWEGLTVEELERRYNVEYHIWKTNPDKAIFPGEGNLVNVLKRLKIFLDDIVCSEFNRIVIVTHGGIIKLSIIYLLGLDLSFYNKCWFGNASLSIVDVKDNKIMLSLLNDMSHLRMDHQNPII